MTDPPGSLIDLHAHTRHKSLDSGLAPDLLAERVKETGLDAICITEHNNIWSVEEAAELSERHGLAVIRGMEVSTDAGHVLVFGVEGYTLEMTHLEKLRAITEREGGAMVLAHPLRGQGFRRPWDVAPHLFEALECYNGDDHNRSSEYLLAIMTNLGMRGTGGSDAHSAPAVGRRATRFRTPIRDERDIVVALQAGAFEPVDLSQTRTAPAGTGSLDDTPRMTREKRSDG